MSNLIRIYGDIGTDVLATDVAQALTTAGGRPVEVHLFSYGGSAGEGLAIYNLLSSYKGQVQIVIDGVAASAGSIIAMAGDLIQMPSNALLMLHTCWADASGNAEAMRTSAATLDTYSQSYCSSYAARSGQSIETVHGWMAAGKGSGTWFTAAEALAVGLVDEVLPPNQPRNPPAVPQGRFKSTPQALAVWALPTVQLTQPTIETKQMTTELATAENSDTDELSPAEARRQLQVVRAANLAGLSNEETETILASTTTASAGVMAVLKAHASVVESRAVGAGHPARVDFKGTGNPDSIQSQFDRAIRGEALEQPLWLTLRGAGLGQGNDAREVWASALSSTKRNWLAPSASLSTSDLPNLLTATGDRRLLDRFALADGGIRVAATVRALTDYRAASVIDVGLVGNASRIYEGGEVKFVAVGEAAGSYAPHRFALGLTLTPESLANDDLSGFDAALSELSAALLDQEALALCDLLEGAATGRNAPDGAAIFHSSHNNVVATGGIGLASLAAGVSLLRQQTAIGGRFIQQTPSALIVHPDKEGAARQLLTDTIVPAQSSNVNPWAGLQVAVEPRLNGDYAYLVASGSRAPLELGRLGQAPQLTSEIQFETGAFRSKAEHAFGVAVSEHRSIIRIATAA